VGLSRVVLQPGDLRKYSGLERFMQDSFLAAFLMKSHPLPNSRGYRDSATRRARHLGVQLDVGKVSSLDLPEKLEA